MRRGGAGGRADPVRGRGGEQADPLRQSDAHGGRSAEQVLHRYFGDRAVRGGGWARFLHGRAHRCQRSEGYGPRRGQALRGGGRAGGAGVGREPDARPDLPHSGRACGTGIRRGVSAGKGSPAGDGGYRRQAGGLSGSGACSGQAGAEALLSGRRCGALPHGDRSAFGTAGGVCPWRR